MKKLLAITIVFVFMLLMLACDEEVSTDNPTLTGTSMSTDNPTLTGTSISTQDNSNVSATDSTTKTEATTAPTSAKPKLVTDENADTSMLPDVDGFDGYAASGKFSYNFSADDAFFDEASEIAYTDLVSYILSFNNRYDISFSYYNIESGCRLDYRADTTYDTCSVIKAPFSLYLLQSGKNLDEMIPCSNYIGGSGVLTKADVGKDHTVREYIEDAIKYSDNCAYMTLLDHFGREDFTEYLKGTGNVNTRLYNCSFGWMSASDAVIAMKDIYNAKDSDYGSWLIDLMSNTEFNGLLTSAGLPWQVAHKFGDDETRICLHDATIVFADHPYILTVFSHMNENTEMETATEVFANIARKVDTLNSVLTSGN